MNTKVNNKRPGSTFKLPLTKFNTVPSLSRTKSTINKQENAQGSTKSQPRSYSIESMDSNNDHIVVSFDLEDIIKITTILETI